MNSLIIYIQLFLTAVLVATSCTLPGTFLILRGTSLISDAISHAILLGIVLSFLIFQKFYIPLLFSGAICMGLITIACIEYLIQTKRLHPDAIIGVVFPCLFSIAVILINFYAQNIHLDIDAVILGELAFTPFYQIYWRNLSIGSYAIWLMIFILLINITMTIIFYRKLITSTFDPDYASIIGYQPKLTFWILMTTTCITILGAFESAGTILVIAFIIIPPSTAFLITHRITHMIIISILISILGSIIGSIFAHIMHISIAGSIATIQGVLFGTIALIQYLYKKNYLTFTMII